MSLITAHRILIGTAVVFFILFAFWELRDFLVHGRSGALGVAAGSFAVAAVFGWYFTTIRQRYEKRPPAARG